MTGGQPAIGQHDLDPVGQVLPNPTPTAPEVVSIHPLVAFGQWALLTLNSYGFSLLSA